jgi:hypothetical protein
MNARKARLIRKVLDMTRIPKEMPPQERRHYRQVKQRYLRLPSTAREPFLDNVSRLKYEFAQLSGAANT